MVTINFWRDRVFVPGRSTRGGNFAVNRFSGAVDRYGVCCSGYRMWSIPIDAPSSYFPVRFQVPQYFSDFSLINATLSPCAVPPHLWPYHFGTFGHPPVISSSWHTHLEHKVHLALKHVSTITTLLVLISHTLVLFASCSFRQSFLFREFLYPKLFWSRDALLDIRPLLPW